MSLADIPTYDPDPEASRQRMLDSCSKHGFASYAAGIGLDYCPPFVDNDMACSWRIGWHHAHELEWKKDRKRAKKRCVPECGHP